MGKGDRKTKRGKIWMGSYGKTRLTHEHDKSKTAEAKPAPATTEE